jgi:hypothetical protein
MPPSTTFIERFPFNGQPDGRRSRAKAFTFLILKIPSLHTIFEEKSNRKGEED